MPKIKTSYGIVGFFDILGYANFLENNDPEEAARIVIANLLKLKKSLQNYHAELIPDSKPDLREARDVLKSIDSLVFSDTILLTLAYPDGANKGTKIMHWFLFLANAILLYRHLFDSGLPIRGALACGKFLVHETCFAGRNIIEAYRLAQHLDFAGVVLADSAAREVSELKIVEVFSACSLLVQRYLAPLKDSGSRPLLTLAPSLITVPKETLPQDIRQYIVNTFWQHNKDLPPSEMKKIDNTELLFRFFRMVEPRLFGEENSSQQGAEGDAIG